MKWRVGAVVLLVVSIVGAVVRVQERDYIFLSASLTGLVIAMWLWKKGGPAQVETKGASE